MYGGRRGVIITTASAVTCQPWSAVFQAMPSSRRRTDLPAVHCPPHRSHRLPLPGPPAASISSVSQGAPVEMPKDSPASAITIYNHTKFIDFTSYGFTVEQSAICSMTQKPVAEHVQVIEVIMILGNFRSLTELLIFGTACLML